MNDIHTTLVSLPLRSDADIEFASQRVRAITEMLSLSPERRGQLDTAVTELARNAVAHGGGGDVDVDVDADADVTGAVDSGAQRPACLVRVRDHGPGIPDIDRILAADAPAGPGGGLQRARALVDGFEIDSSSSGTTVEVTMWLGQPADPASHSESARIAEYREAMQGPVTHALRSPLAAILVATELLRSRESDPFTEKVVGRIESCTNRALRMISTLLDYTHSQLSHELPIVPAAHNVVELVQVAVDKYRRQHPKRTLTFEREEGAISANIDSERVAQALENLLGDAGARASLKQPVAITVATEGDTVVVAIRHRGEVMSPDTLARIFEPFVSAAKRADPMGLGLYVAREIARAHGGTAEMLSDSDQGTVARLILPRQV